MKTLLTILIILLSVTAPAQTTFEKVYSDSGITTARDIITTFDGGYAVTGFKTCSTFNCLDFFLLKLDSLGNQEWVRLYDGFNTDDDAFSVIQTIDSGFVLAGGASVPPNFGQNIRLLKTDKIGNKLWDRNYGGTTGWDHAFDIIETLDSGFILATQYDTAATLLKTDAMGLFMWQKIYGHLVGSGYSVKQLIDSSFIMTGATNDKISPTSMNDIFLLKTNKNGDTLWTKIYGNQGSERGQDVIVTSNRDYVISGYTTEGGNSLIAACVIKTNSLGDTLWTRIFEPSTNQNVLYKLVEDNGNYVFAGYRGNPSSSNDDFYLLKMDSIGNKLWEKNFEYQANAGDGAYSIALGHDGGYIMCGLTASPGLAQVYIVKTDTNGLITGVNDFIPTTATNINVYPNPFNNYTTIDLSEIFEYGSNYITIELYDYTGKLLFQQQVNEAKTMLYNQGYAKGMYLLRIKDNHQLITTKKLIIN